MRTSHIARHLLLVALVAMPSASSAFTATITNENPRALYLRVGDGEFRNGTYVTGGRPRNGRTGGVAVVEANVPAGVVGNGSAIPMTTPSNPRLTSDWDGYSFCSSGQVYVGGFYRSGNGSGADAQLSYMAPPSLVNASGQSIPISQISWNTSGNGDAGGPGAQPIPPGTFAPGPNPLTTFPSNTWRESCLTFSYANQNLVAAGTYQATVKFTLAQP